MKSTYTNVFDKIDLSEEKKESIRNNIAKSENVRQNKRIPISLRLAAAAVLMAAVIMAVPQSRAAAFSAFNYITGIFRFADDSEVSITADENSVAVSFDYTGEERYFSVSGGRLYFDIDNIHKDITNAVSSSKYFRYEKQLENGRSVIFVGGSPDLYGWIELLFDNNGNYITNRMNVPTVDGLKTEEWANIAMHNEGVPCGDPELDNQLSNGK